MRRARAEAIAICALTPPAAQGQSVSTQVYVRVLRTPAGVQRLRDCDEVVVSADGYPDARVGIVEVKR